MSTVLPDKLADESSTKKEDPYIFFWKTTEPYGPFSQWSSHPFTLNGKKFANTEQYMMYHKARIMRDHNTARTILENTKLHPAKYKKMGRMVKNFDQKLWDEVSLSVVAMGNLAKFTGDEELRELLVGTGDKMIVEASPFDRIWGIGFTEEDAIGNIERWGMNKLGEALMMVRKIIKDRLVNGVEDPFVDTSELVGVSVDSDMDVDWLRSTDLFMDK